jgi:hypothetical protein
VSTTEPTPPEGDAAAQDAAPAVPTPDEQMGGAPAQPDAAAPEPAASTEPMATAAPADGAQETAASAGAATSPLEEAEATEAVLRAQLGELVSARVRAEAEASRLADRATLAGADPSLLDLSARYRDQAGRLAAEVEGLRGQLRAHEARAEALRADAQGV